MESEEDCAEEGRILAIWIGLELGMDVDDEWRSDGREQARLGEQVRDATRMNAGRRMKIRVVFRSSSYFLM